MSRVIVFIVIVFLILNIENVQSQISSPTANGIAATSYTSGAPNDDIFIFCGAGNNGQLQADLTVGNGPFTYQWFTYVVATHSWSLMVGQSTSSLSNLASGGYRVEVANNSGASVLCDVAWVWNLDVALNAQATISGCSNVDLNVVIPNTQFTYNNPPSPLAAINANTDITVCFSGHHTYVSDLGYYLVGPASCGSPVVTLAANNGSICNPGNNFNNLCFTTQNAPNFNVCNQNTPLSGTFDSAYGTPIDWSPIYGCNATESGWSVMVFDCEMDDVGYLSNATIAFSGLQTFCGTTSTINYNSGNINSNINDISCSVNSASNFTVPPPASIAAPLVLTATNSGLWTSAGTGVIADPTLSNADVVGATNGDLFTYTLSVNVGSANCTFFDDVVLNNNNLVTLSLSYPLNLCEGGGLINPILSGPGGGQYTSSPTGLSIQGNGNIQLNTSNPGSYVVTYTKNVGGCALTTSVGITVQDIPENLTMSPASICDGETFNGDAQIAYEYEYFLNGISQSSPNISSNFVSPILSATDDWCVRGYEAPTIILDGNISESYWGAPLSQANIALTSSFGNNHLDAMYVAQFREKLNIAVAGQLENGSNNRIFIFLDTEAGGYNQLSSWTNRSNAPYYSMESLSGDIQFDNGFEPDYILAVNTDLAGVSYLNLYHMSTNTDQFIGNSNNPMVLAYQGAGNAINIQSGYEMQLTLANLNNPSGKISLFAMLVNDPGSTLNPTTLSNQFLTPAGNGELSYGNGFVDFNLAEPDPVYYVVGSSLCYLENCLTINPNLNVTLPTVPDQCLNTPSPFVLNASINGVAGTWAPAVVDVSLAGTTLYSFTPDPSAGCYAEGTLPVTVVNPATANFTVDDAYCQGETPDVLPSSDGVIIGTWSPAAITTNSTAATAPVNYVFTPSGNQCAADYTLTVTVNPTENPVFSFVTSLCQNATAPTLPLVDDNGIQGSWSGAVSTAVLGNQTLTFTPTPDPAHACAVPSTVDFNITNGTPSTFAPIGPFCETDNPSLPNVSAEGFTGTWSPSNIDMTNYSSAGQSFTFQPDPNQCANSGTLTVVVLDAVDATFNFSTTYCQGDAAATLPSNSLNGFSGSWLPNAIATNNPGPSNYVFTPNAGSCANVTTVGITINTPIAPVFSLPLTVCENGSAPSLPANSNNGIAGSWSPSVVNTTITGNQNFVFTHNPNVCATDYNYSIDVTSNQTPTFNGIGPFCVNATAPALPANSNEGIAGSWNPAAINTAAIGTSSYSFTPNAGVCAVNQTIQVVIDSQIAPTFSSIPALCSTETAPVLSTISNNGISGVWSPSAVNMAVLGNSSYTFTPAPNQCASNANLNVNVIAPVNPLFSFTTSYCVGELTDVLPGISDDLYTGVWSPNIIDASAASVINYTFTVDAGQCANDVLIPVSINPPSDAVFAALDLDFCLDEIAPNLPITDDSGMSGTWSPMNIETNASGSLIHTFTPNFGECGNPTDFTVVVNVPSNSVISGMSAQYCLNEIVQNLPVQNDDLIPGTWSPSSIVTNMIGSTDYVFTPNAGTCYTEYIHTVETLGLPQINYVLSDPEINCNVPIVTITASGGVDYLWSDGSTFDYLDVSDDLPVVVTVTDINGCQNDATIVVPMDTQTNAQLVYNTTELTCQTTSIHLAVLGGQLYSWNPNGEINNSIVVTVPGTYGVDVLFDNGCSQSLSLVISQDTLSPIGVIQNLSGTDELTCNQTSIMLQANGGVSYQWINGGANSQQSISQPGMVEVEVTAANFCLDTVSYSLTQDIVPPVVNISAANPMFDCFVDEIALTASGNAQSYLWANGLGSANTIDCNQSGTYSVTGTGMNGCTSTASMILPVNRFHPDSVFEYSPFEIWDDNPTVTLNGPSQNNIVYHWSLDGEEISDLSDFTFDLPSFTPGEFEVCLNAYFSDICQSSFCQTLWVNEALQVYIPTAFTPGYDGVNDGFRPVFSNNKLIEKFHMEIFDRWGQKVFETTDVNRGWDGDVLGTGNYAPDGSYVVIIKYRSVYDEDEKVHKGQVTFTR